jgi:glycosidase
LYLKRVEDALTNGVYENIPNSSQNVISFTRTSKKGRVLVVINLSGDEEFAFLEDPNNLRLDNLRLLSGSDKVVFPRGSRGISVPAYGVQVWKVMHK